MAKREEAIDKARNIFNKMQNPVSEMSMEEIDFLCELLEKYNPENVVEVGVAEGGTSAVILRQLEINGRNGTLTSVDLNEKYYRDTTKMTGYLVDEVKESLPNYKNHIRKYGFYLPEVIEDIGHNIDFVILDTVHSLPGELLDFIVILPYLTSNAVIVIHDITLGHKGIYSRRSISNSILFNAASGRKIWNYKTSPNIAALEVNDYSKENIEDIFSLLSIPWEYFPKEREIDIYERSICSNYSEHFHELFAYAIKLQAATKEKYEEYVNDCIKKVMCTSKSSEGVFVFGAGRYGKKICNYIEDRGIKCKGFVVTNVSENDEMIIGKQVVSISSLSKKESIIYGIKNKDAYYSLCEKGFNVILLPEELYAIV